MLFGIVVGEIATLTSVWFCSPLYIYQVADVGSRKKTNYDVVRDPPARPAAVCECGESEDPKEFEQTFKIETGNLNTRLDC